MEIRVRRWSYWRTPCKARWRWGVKDLLNIILLGLQPPTICAKSYMAYNAFRHYYRIKLQNGVLLAANALFS
jgi:hypothetical protein